MFLLLLAVWIILNGKITVEICVLGALISAALFYFGSLSIVGVGFVKIPPQFYEKGSFYV